MSPNLILKDQDIYLLAMVFVRLNRNIPAWQEFGWAGQKLPGQGSIQENYLVRQKKAMATI